MSSKRFFGTLTVISLTIAMVAACGSEIDENGARNGANDAFGQGGPGKRCGEGGGTSIQGGHGGLGLTSMECPDEQGADGGVRVETPADGGATADAAPAAADCTVAGGTTRTWTVGDLTCSGPASATTVADGASVTITSTNENTGAAGFQCKNGVLSISPNGSQTCTAPNAPCTLPATETEVGTETRTETQTLGCPTGSSGQKTQTQAQQRTRTRTAYCPSSTGAYAWGDWSAWGDWAPTGPWTTTADSCKAVDCAVADGTTRTWTVGEHTCSGPTSATTLADGASVTITSTNGKSGTASFQCNGGVLSASPDGSQTCTAPATPCTVPVPETEVVTESRTETQTLGCQPGYAGQITQSRPQQRARTRTAYCPAPTGAFSWGDWSNWSAWSPTGPWTTTSDTCKATDCTVPAGTPRTWTVGDQTCSGPTTAATVADGASLTVSSTNGKVGAAGFKCNAGVLSSSPDGSQTCDAACTLPSPSTETGTEAGTETQTLACQPGYVGQITQTREQKRTRTRTAICPAPTGPYSWGAWGAWSAWSPTSQWTTTSDTCKATDCTVAAGTVRTWTVGDQTCSGPWGATTFADGASVTIQSTNGKIGAAGFTCNAGVLSSSPNGTQTCDAACTLPAQTTDTQVDSRTETQTEACQAGYVGQITKSQMQLRSRTRTAYCPAPTGSYAWGAWSAWSAWSPAGPWTVTNDTCAPAPCTVPAGTTRTWTVGGQTCSGPSGAATVASGASLTITSTNGKIGSAGFTCSLGVLSSSPNGTQTCDAACTLPSPVTQSERETRTQGQVLACPAGYVGQITQSQPQERTRTHTAYCPAPTGAFSWGAWSAWSAWSGTGPWTETGNTCEAAACTVPAGTVRTWTVAGQTCSGPSGAATVASGASLTITSTNGKIGDAGFKCTLGVLSATPDGSQTCNAACTLPVPSTETNTEARTGSQVLACPAGQTGSITQTRSEQRTQTRTASCPAPTGSYVWSAWSAWSAWTGTTPWVTTANTCATTPTGVCPTRPLTLGCGVFDINTNALISPVELGDYVGPGFYHGQYVRCVLGYEDALDFYGFPEVPGAEQMNLIVDSNGGPCVLPGYDNSYGVEHDCTATVVVYARKADGTRGNRCFGAAKVTFNYEGN